MKQRKGPDKVLQKLRAGARGWEGAGMEDARCPGRPGTSGRSGMTPSQKCKPTETRAGTGADQGRGGP